MNIQELQSERNALQNRLRDFIREELEQFQKSSGVYVESVSVGIMSYKNIGDRRYRYFVEDVQVDLDI